MILLFGQFTGPGSSVSNRATIAHVVQLSVAVGAVHETIAVVPDVPKFIFVGQAVKTGGMTSVVHGFVALDTVTSCKTSQSAGH